MSKSLSTKSKPQPPWIPPGKGIPQYKRRAKPVTIIKSKKDDFVSPEVSFKVPPQWDTVPKTGANQDETDMMSSSSHSSYELEGLNQENEFDFHHVSLLQEMKLLYVHFASVKTSFLSAHRLIDSQDIENSDVHELFTEAGSFLKRLNSLFDDLEYSIAVLENTLDDNMKKIEFSTVLKIKEKLLSTLLAMYDKVILIFHVVFEKQDFKELSRAHESLSEKLKVVERKCSTQEAVITDLERKLSIYQSKTAAIENYKANIESAKVELEKRLLHKEAQIKYLSDELMNASGKYSKSDREDFIEIIESIKSKAHTEKSALKKALKFLKEQSKEKEGIYKKQLEEANEKEKMIFDLADQRDQLKVTLTVVNNNIIQLKQHIEEMKIQNLKLQNEMIEKDTSHKKEVTELKSSVEEKSTELEKMLKKNKKLEEMAKELENELKKSEERFKALKGDSSIPQQLNSHLSKETNMGEEIPRLVALLQSTRETFESLVHSSHFKSASGDHITENTEFGSNQKEILSAISEIKKYILELRNQLLSFLHDQTDATEPKSLLKQNDLEKQFKKMEHLYKSAIKENESLKQKIEDLTNSNMASAAAQNTENYLSADASSDHFSKKLQLELCKKDNEIASLKFKLAEQGKDVENHLRESQAKLRTLEIDHEKISSLQEELKNTKLELAFVQRKKEEEMTSLLHRAEELQESLDKKNAECRNLEQYIDLMKTSFCKVFDNS